MVHFLKGVSPVQGQAHSHNLFENESITKQARQLKNVSFHKFSTSCELLSWLVRQLSECIKSMKMDVSLYSFTSYRSK